MAFIEATRRELGWIRQTTAGLATLRRGGPPEGPPHPGRLRWWGWLAHNGRPSRLGQGGEALVQESRFISAIQDFLRDPGFRDHWGEGVFLSRRTTSVRCRDRAAEGGVRRDTCPDAHQH
jgi:hypothetical protein